MAEFLNKNIRFLRIAKGLSQQTLADKVGIDRSTISRIENNEIETTIDNAIKISEVLNVSLSDLINCDLTVENNNSSDDYAVLFNKYKQLSQEDKELIMNIIETRKKQIDKELDEKE